MFNEAVELCAYLCGIFGLDPTGDGVILGHHEAHQRGIASNHADPQHWFKRFGESMDSFRAAVVRSLALAPSDPVIPPPVPEPAVPDPAPSTPETPSHEIYTVAKGDTLWRIAVEKLGTGARYTEIKKLNALASDTIYVGQKLKIPKE